MCFTTNEEVSRPLTCYQQMRGGEVTSALASAFFNSPSKNFADFSGQRAKSAKSCLRGVFTQISAEFFPLGSPSNGPVESSEGDCLLMLNYIIEVLDRFLKFQSVDCLGGLTRVLEVHAEVRAAGLGGLCWVDGGGCVAYHGW
jgi:hypothetical protein